MSIWQKISQWWPQLHPTRQKLANLYGTIPGTASNSTFEIKLLSPINHDEARSFYLYLPSCQQVWHHGNQEQPIHFFLWTIVFNLPKSCLHNDTLKTFWSNAMVETKNYKELNGKPKPNTSKWFATPFLNYVASNGYPITTGNCLLHYMHRGKKKSHGISP